MKQKGHLIYDFKSENFVFRVYDEKDKRKFIDYKLCVEDLGIVIDDNYVRLNKEENKIEYKR
jgi:hypothetical protein